MLKLQVEVNTVICLDYNNVNEGLRIETSVNCVLTVLQISDSSKLCFNCVINFPY